MRTRLHRLAVIGVLVAVPLAGAAQKTESRRPASYEIPLASRTFAPKPGVEPSLREAAGGPGRSSVHAFVQLSFPLDLATLKELNGNGITLLEPVFGTTYLAAIRRGAKLEGGEGQRIRWAGEVRPEDKIQPDLRREKYATYGIDFNGRLTLVAVFHKDTGREAAQTVLKATATKFEPLMTDQWKIVIARDRLRQLAAADEVKWIEQGPVPFLPLNDQVRGATQVEAVQGFSSTGGVASYTGLDGKGVIAVLFDRPADADHDDFWEHDAAGNRTTSRFLVSQAVWANEPHGTHVAGIIGGNGFQSDKSSVNGPNGGTPFQWRGMAPNARLLSMVNGGNSVPDYDQAIRQTHAEVSNHSYVQTCGDYSAVSNGVDTILRGDASWNGMSIPAHTMVWAAGNNGSFSQYCGTSGYYTMLSPAKNPIVVAATNADDPSPASRAYFSSLGPTMDGRLKPDVSAPGCKTTSAVVSTLMSSNGYTQMCGTSMASPATTGTVALLLEQWHQTYGLFEPWPSSMKVALIQGAADLVDTTNPWGWPNNPDTGAPTQYHAGPDYATGYGLINAVASRDLIAQHRIVQDTISTPGELGRYQVAVPAGATRLRVTLAWDDEAGSVMTSQTTPKLVNDLDLVVTSPVGTVVQPWVLPSLPQATTMGMPDPIAPADVQPAQHGLDHINNVEQVEVSNPAQGTWSVRVKGTALPMGNPQPYSLVADFGISDEPIRTLPPPHRLDPCINLGWQPVRGFGLVLDLPPGFTCGLISFPPICIYIIDCSPCGPFGVCPPYDMQFPGIPDFLRLQVFDENGRQLSDPVSRAMTRLTFTPEPGVRPYLVVFAQRGHAPPGPLRIQIVGQNTAPVKGGGVKGGAD